MFYLGELQEDHQIEHGTSSGHGNNPARAEIDRETRGAPSSHNPQQKLKQQLIRSNQRQESNPTTNLNINPTTTTNLLQPKSASTSTSNSALTSIFRYKNSISNSTICENTATTNPNCHYIPAITNTNTNTKTTMPLSTILSKNSLLSYSSYGSIDTFSDYHDTADLPTFINSESGIDYGRTNNSTIRRIEVCRRHTISTVLLITIVVIIFGMTGEDPEDDSDSAFRVSRLCQQFLIFLVPESSSSSSSPEEN